MLLNCAQMNLSHLLIHSEDVCYLLITEDDHQQKTEFGKTFKYDILAVFYVNVLDHLSAKLNSELVTNYMHLSAAPLSSLGETNS